MNNANPAISLGADQGVKDGVKKKELMPDGQQHQGQLGSDVKRQ